MAKIPFKFHLFFYDFLSDEHFKLSCDWARASFNMNATKVACGSADGAIYIWNIMGKLEAELKGHM